MVTNAEMRSLKFGDMDYELRRVKGKFLSSLIGKLVFESNFDCSGAFFSVPKFGDMEYGLSSLIGKLVFECNFDCSGAFFSVPNHTPFSISWIKSIWKKMMLTITIYGHRIQLN